MFHKFSLKSPVCGSLLQQPQEMNTDSKIATPSSPPCPGGFQTEVRIPSHSSKTHHHPVSAEVSSLFSFLCPLPNPHSPFSRTLHRRSDQLCLVLRVLAFPHLWSFAHAIPQWLEYVSAFPFPLVLQKSQLRPLRSFIRHTQLTFTLTLVSGL